MKKVITVVLAISMLMSLFVFTANAQDEFKYSQIAYFNEGGERIYSFSGGEELTAKIKVRSETQTDKLFFAMFLYKDNKLVDVAIDADPDAVDVTAVTYEAKTIIPDDADGLKIVTILWKNALTMEEICSSSILPSSDARLTSLTVDGVPVADFAPDVYEYTMEVKADKIYAPVIGCTAADNGAKVNVTDAVKFPGESTIEVIASDGSTAQYKVTYVCNDELVTFVTQNANLKLQKNYRAGIPTVVNRNVNTCWVHPSLEGLDYIGCVAGLGSFEFILNRPAKVSVFFQGMRASTGKSRYPDWEVDSKGWDGLPLNNWPDDETLPEEEWTYGENNKRLTDGLNEMPATGSTSAERNKEYTAMIGSKYDVRNQGWMYVDYREIQNHRHHGHCALSAKFTKTFEADDNGVFTPVSIVVNGSGTDFGVPAVIEWADYLPSDTDTELIFE